MKTLKILVAMTALMVAFLSSDALGDFTAGHFDVTGGRVSATTLNRPIIGFTIPCQENDTLTTLALKSFMERDFSVSAVKLWVEWNHIPGWQSNDTHIKNVYVDDFRFCTNDTIVFTDINLPIRDCGNHWWEDTFYVTIDVHYDSVSAKPYMYHQHGLEIVIEPGYIHLGESSGKVNVNQITNPGYTDPGPPQPPYFDPFKLMFDTQGPPITLSWCFAVDGCKTDTVDQMDSICIRADTTALVDPGDAIDGNIILDLSEFCLSSTFKLKAGSYDVAHCFGGANAGWDSCVLIPDTKSCPNCIDVDSGHVFYATAQDSAGNETTTPLYFDKPIDTCKPNVDSIQFYLAYDADGDGIAEIGDSLAITAWALSNADFEVDSMIANLSVYFPSQASMYWQRLDDTLNNNRIFRRRFMLEEEPIHLSADNPANRLTIWAWDDACNYDTAQQLSNLEVNLYSGNHVIHVPADFLTIQAAIDAALDGDTVLVAQGTYTGDGNRDIAFGGKAIMVTSEEGAESTIIDCEGSSSDQHRGFSFHYGEDSTSVLEGFTITGGYISGDGGGIICYNSSPLIMNCTITSNVAAGAYGTGGGGVCCYASNAVIRNCKISSNTSTGETYGAGILFTSGSAGLLEDSHVDHNIAQMHAAGIACLWGASPKIRRCILSNNTSGTSGALYCSDASADISHCLISNNHSDHHSGGISCYYGAAPFVNNCTIYGNTSDESSAGAIYVGYAGGVPVVTNTICWNNYPSTQVSAGVIVTFSDIQGGWGDPADSNINCYPMFCSPDTGNFYLAGNSCCVGAGQGGVDIGAFGVGCVLDHALQFDGTDDFVDCGATLTGEIFDSLTVEAYINLAEVPVEQSAILYDGEDGEFGLWVNSAGHAVFQIKLVDETWYSVFSDSPIPTSQWVHLAGVWNSADSSITVYVDGQLQDVVSIPDLPLYVPSGDYPPTIGAYRGSILGTRWYFAGTIDEVRIWNVTRTQSEIHSTMYCELDSAFGLVSCYHFNEGSGQTVYDPASGNDGRLGTTFDVDDQDPAFISPGAVYDPCSFVAPPILSLSSDSLFGDSISFYPIAGDEVTLFEFRINYRDSSNFWPQIGSPRLVLDWDGNGVIDHENDGYFSMSQSEVDSVFTDGADYSVFLTIPAGGNPQIKFEAVSSYGLTAVYPASGWLDGPTIIDPNSTDLLLYADDITYSKYPENPEVGEPVTIFARVHNNSSVAFDDVDINLCIDDSVVASFQEHLPARDMYGNAGYVDIYFDTVFNEVAFLEIKVTVDPDDDIAEWNEYNNTAMRALFIGDYDLPGYIVVNAFTLGSYYPMTWVGGGGTAWYEENEDSLEQLSGTPVYVKLLEGNIPLDTVYVNDLGYFGYAFQAPMDTGLYHIHLTITDFTMTDTAVVPFRVVPYPSDSSGPNPPPTGPNLVIDYDLCGFPINVCTRHLSVGSPIVYNVGNESSGPCKAVLVHGPDTLLDCSVISLEPGQFQILSATGWTVTHTEPGSHSIVGRVDYDNEVAELGEGDNSKSVGYYVWCCPEDLHPTDINFSGVAYARHPIDIKAKVYNIGGLPADDFKLKITDSYWGGDSTIAILENLSLPAFGVYSWWTVEDYGFPDTGWHQVTITADPLGEVDECNEDNNVYYRSIYIDLPMADLYTSYDNITVDDPNAIEGDTVQFQALVGNGGDSAAFDFNVYFGLDGEGYTETPSVHVSYIRAGSDTLIKHPDLWIVDFSKCPLESYVDSGNVIQEYNEGNNYGTVPIPYDFYPVYSGRCPGYGYGPHFFDVCDADTGEPVTINLSAKNSGLFNFNDSLLFAIYDSLAGAPSPDTICLNYISDTLKHHSGSQVSDGYTHYFTEYGVHFVTVELNPGQVVVECNYDNNSTTYSIEIDSTVPPPPFQPDLLIQTEWILPSALNPDLGDTFYIANVDVYNQGDTTAFDVEILFFMDGDTLGELVTIDSIPSYGPNNYRPVQPTDSVVVDTCEPATRIFRVCADPFDTIPELSELNNCATKSIIFCEAPELYVKDIYFDPDCARVGDLIDIIAVIADTGEASASAIVKFYYLDNPEGGWSDTTYIGSAGIDNIEAGDTVGVEVTVPWEIALDSTYIYVEISYTYPHDYYAPNNYASEFLDTYICGDANHDGTVGPADVVYLINYLFRDGPEPLPCLASGDVTGDGPVDGADIVYLINYLYRNGPAPCSQEPWILAKGQAGSAELTIYVSERNQKSVKLAVDGKFDVDVAAVQLELEWDRNSLAFSRVLPATRTQQVGLYHNHGRNGSLKVGIVDISGKISLPAGEHRLLEFDFHSNGRSIDLSNIELKKAIVVDRDARKLIVNIVNRLSESNLPRQFSLSQNYPNPFNPRTVIHYALPCESEVQVTIYNVLGQKVKTLVNGHQQPGYNRIVWDCMNDEGQEVASGVYFYKIKAGDFTDSKKMVILK